MRNTRDYYEERVTRYLELAEAAQEAAGRAASLALQETYAQLANQWVHLAGMAYGMIEMRFGPPQPVAADRCDHLVRVTN